MTEESLEDALARCADLHVRGEVEEATRLLHALTPRIARVGTLSGFQRERLETLLELDRVREVRAQHSPLLTGLARAVLAGDTGPLDEHVLAAKGLPNTDAFAMTPHLRRAYEDTLTLRRERQGIEYKAKWAVILFALGVFEVVWELWLRKLFGL